MPTAGNLSGIERKARDGSAGVAGGATDDGGAFVWGQGIGDIRNQADLVALVPQNTDALPEGPSGINIYFTDERAQDAFAALIAAGTHSGVTFSYNDAGNALSATVTAGYSDEQAQDAIAALLAAGTHVGISFAYNDAGNALSATVTGGGGAMTLINTVTVTGSATTALTMTGLNLAADQHYYIVYSVKNATGSALNISLFYNGDTTPANYWNNYVTSSTTSARSNNAAIISLPSASTTVQCHTGIMTLSNDIELRPRLLLSGGKSNPTAIDVIMVAHVWTTVANVTSITLTASIANGLAVGSFFRVFKVN